MRSVRQVVIERPPEEVLAFVSDPTNDPQWHDSILEATLTSEPPLRAASTFTAVYRRPGDSATHDLVGEITTYEPGQSSVLEATFVRLGGRTQAIIGQFRLSFQVKPEGSGTRLTRIVETHGAALPYRLLLLMLAPLLRRSNNARQDKLLARIKTILETGTAVNQTSAGEQ